MSQQDIQCAISYEDTVSLSLSTSLLFHYPTPSFARLPVSLTLSLDIFSATVSCLNTISDCKLTRVPFLDYHYPSLSFGIRTMFDGDSRPLIHP